MLANAYRAKPDERPLIDQGLLRDVQSLPVLPWLWRQVMGHLDNRWSSLGDLEGVIRLDHSLSSAVISAANSSYYGAARRITTVSRASAVLGLEEVRRLCLATGLCQLMDSGDGQQLADSQELWRHCLDVAAAAALLARGRRGLDVETAFTAGLLHDLGKVLLVARFPRAYRVVRHLQAREGLTWLEAEEMLDLDHQELGLYLAEHWNLPPLLTEVIGRHHHPQAGLSHWPLVALVHLADGLARQEQALAGERAAWAGAEETWQACLAAVGLDRAGLETCRQRFQIERRTRHLGGLE
ncbi:MAG: HDOD domain-containing protein [Pseudomonadota bacterium]